MKKYTDQEFLYRQTPVNYDGIAKFTSIKGNTLGWNQLVPSLSTMSAQNGTLSVADNVATITSSSSVTYLGIATSGSPIVLPKGGHKYLLTVEVNSPKALSSCNLWYGNSITYIQRNIPANTWTKVSTMASYGTPAGQYVQLRAYGSFEQGDTLQVRNWNYFDLTAMGLDSLTEDEFTSLFPLPYYDYNQGTLIPFSGNGIKTTGKNLYTTTFRESFSDMGVTFTYMGDGRYIANGTATGTRWLNLSTNTSNFVHQVNLPRGTYTFSIGTDKMNVYTYASSDLVIVSQGRGKATIVDSPLYAVRMLIPNGTVFNNTEIYMQIEVGSTATSYEPYTSSTLSLPISNYFPTGMKRAGNVYDELTENKAITRVGAVDLGSLTWNQHGGDTNVYFVANMPYIKKQSVNFVCALYQTVDAKGNITIMPNMSISADGSADNYLYLRNNSITSDVNALKTSLNGAYLYYELATETETDAEDIFYKFYGNGTEEILPSALLNGSVDLGTLNWAYSPADSTHPLGFFYTTSIANRKGGATNLECEKFVTSTSWSTDKSIQGNANNYAVYVVDSAYTDATAFKNSLSGVLLYYQKSDSTPATSPIIADIEYYNQIDSETPYRKFWLVNGNGDRWNLTEKELKSFLDSPQGLGFQKSIDVTRYGERAYKNTEDYNFPQVSGDVFFYDTANATRYEKYNEFVRFLMVQPLTLYYQIPVSIYSGIADIYTLDCEVINLTKTESKTNRVLTSNIQINGLGFYQGDTVEINGTANEITINNDGDFPVGFEIELNGDFENPYITLEQDGELYGEAKFDDEGTNFSSVYVNSKDGEQNVVLKQNDSILPNPLAYQDLSISNGSVYVTFVKLAKGESTLKIGADSYSISNYSIKFTPMYRSV